MTKSPTQERVPLASPPEVAAYLGVPEATLAQWRFKGTGPQSRRVGKHVRYRWADIETWLDQQAAAR